VLPVRKNPARGWLGSANQFNLPPASLTTAYEWASPSRWDRISRVLDGKPKISLADSMALQNDEHSELALRAVALVKGLPGPAAALLAGWDGNLAADSAPAALYEVWLARQLVPAAVAAIVPAEARPAFAEAEPVAVIAWLEAHPEGRAAILSASLAAAWEDVAARLGPDPAIWRWGTLHQARFVPALALPGRAAEQVVGPVPIGGSSSSPRAATHRGQETGDFTLTAGASVRMVLDVGRWDDSVIINAPGQSGNVGDPHYKDLFPLWAEGRYVPFLWSRDRVMAAAERVISARPAD
jgi:penicillin amidase